MGVSEGVPGSITPNHAGRADYHGACVNLAARFCDAGGRAFDCSHILPSSVPHTWIGSMAVGPAALIIRLARSWKEK